MPIDSQIPLRVLVASDSSEHNNALSSYLDEFGCTHSSVHDSESLFNAVRGREYDVVITNYSMPDLQGKDLVKEIQERRPSQAIIVVAEEELRDDVLITLKESSTIDIFNKPFNIKHIKNALMRIAKIVKPSTNESPDSLASNYSKKYQFTSLELSQTKIELDVLELLVLEKRMDFNTALKVELAFQEALANGLDHGNLELESEWREIVDSEGVDKYSLMRGQRLQDPYYSSRPISIEIHCCEKTLSLWIKDDGKGFLAEQKQSHEVRDEIKCHGRGLTIMSGVMDEVIFRDHGSEIELKITVSKDNNGA